MKRAIIIFLMLLIVGCSKNGVINELNNNTNDLITNPNNEEPNVEEEIILPFDDPLVNENTIIIEEIPSTQSNYSLMMASYSNDIRNNRSDIIYNYTSSKVINYTNKTFSYTIKIVERERKQATKTITHMDGFSTYPLYPRFQYLIIPKYSNLSFSYLEEFITFFKENHENIQKETESLLKEKARIRNELDPMIFEALFVFNNKNLSKWDYSTFSFSPTRNLNNSGVRFRIMSEVNRFQLRFKCNDPTEEAIYWQNLYSYYACDKDDIFLSYCIFAQVNVTNVCVEKGIKEVLLHPLRSYSEYMLHFDNFIIYDYSGDVVIPVGQTSRLSHERTWSESRNMLSMYYDKEDIMKTMKKEILGSNQS